MRLVLGSGGIRTPERLAVWAGEVRAALGPVRRVLLVPYALADHDGYVRSMLDRGLNAGYELDPVHRHPDPAAAVRAAAAIFVGGGNTFRLVDRLHRLGLVEAIRDRVRAGVPYLGVSAGTNAACPTIRTTNDMPIVEPPTLDALGLVPFQVNPHFVPGPSYLKSGEAFVPHHGETREDRLREFHEENAAPVVGLPEGGVLRVEAGRVQLVGAAARVFRRGQVPTDCPPGADLTPLLGPEGLPWSESEPPSPPS